MPALRAPRKPRLARSLCGAALALTLAAPLSAQTVVDYTNGQTRNVGIFAPGPGGLTLNTGAGVIARDASVFAGATGDVVKTGAGILSITAQNDGFNAGGQGGWNWTSLRIAEGTLNVANGATGLSSLGSESFGKTIQIDAGGTLVADTAEAHYGRITGAGTIGVGVGGGSNSRYSLIGPNISTFSGHIGAYNNLAQTISTETSRAADARFGTLGIVNGHRLNFSGTSSDVVLDVVGGGNTVALNGAVLGEVMSNRGRFATSYSISLTSASDTLLIEGDSRVASIKSNLGTVDLGASKLTIFDNQVANNGSVVESSIGSGGVGVLKGSAASVLRKTGRSNLTLDGDASQFFGAIEVAGSYVIIAAATLADDNTLTISGADGRLGQVSLLVDDRVGAIKGDNGTIGFQQGKTLQVGGTATDLGVNTYAGSFIGFSTSKLEFVGRHNTTILSGASPFFQGNVAVNAGKLVVNGTLPATFTVGNGGTLGGSGTAGVVNVSSGGTLAAGNSVGTLNTGNVTLAAGSTLLVEVNAAAADRINAAGTVTLQGGKLHIASTAGTPTSGQVHTIIAATGGVTGTFGSVIDDYAFFDAEAIYGANDVKLRMTRNAQTPVSVITPSPVTPVTRVGTPNQIAAATGLSGLPAGNEVLSAVLGLTTGAVQPAYDSLSGEVHADVQGRSVQGAGNLGSAVLDHLGSLAGTPPAGGNGLSFSTRGTGEEASTGPKFWGKVLGSASQQSRSDGFAAASAGTVGLIGGMDFASEGPWTFGALVAASRTTTTMSDRASDANSTDVAVGLYGGRDFGDVALGFGLMHNISRSDASRRVSVGPINQTLTSSYTTGTTLAFAELSGKLPFRFGTLTPFLRLTQAQTYSGGFTETGGAAALTRAAQTNDVTLAEVGLHGAADIKIAGRDATLTGGISYQTVVAGQFGTSQHGFAAGGNAFNVGAGVGNGQAVAIDLGLEVKLSDATDVNLGYQGSRSGGVDNHQLGLNLSMKF